MRFLRGGRDERGASLVEFAFVVPLLILFTFGIVDFGVTYSNQQALRTAVREGGRRAIVGPAKVKQDGCTTDGDVICLVHARARIGGLKADKTWVKVCFPTAASGVPCPTSPPGDKNIGDTIRICSIYPVESVSGVLSPFLKNLRVTSRVDLRLEQPWAATYTNPTPDTGQRGTWDFCDA